MDRYLYLETQQVVTLDSMSFNDLMCTEDIHLQGYSPNTKAQFQFQTLCSKHTSTTSSNGAPDWLAFASNDWTAPYPTCTRTHDISLSISGLKHSSASPPRMLFQVSLWLTAHIIFDSLLGIMLLNHFFEYSKEGPFASLGWLPFSEWPCLW